MAQSETLEKGRAGIRSRLRSALGMGVALAAIVSTSAACAAESESTPASEQPAAETSRPADAQEAADAIAMVQDYLAEKPWGFFGATCAQWLDIDYLVDEAVATIAANAGDSGETADAGTIRVEFRRRPERMLGPETLVYAVDAAAGTVSGDNAGDSDDGRLGTTEGCDGW